MLAGKDYHRVFSKDDRFVRLWWIYHQHDFPQRPGIRVSVARLIDRFN